MNGGAAGFSQGTICYTNAGIPLLYQFEGSGLGFTMEATSFTVPTDADFTPLAELHELRSAVYLGDGKKFKR